MWMCFLVKIALSAGNTFVYIVDGKVILLDFRRLYLLSFLVCVSCTTKRVSQCYCVDDAVREPKIFYSCIDDLWGLTQNYGGAKRRTDESTAIAKRRV